MRKSKYKLLLSLLLVSASLCACSTSEKEIEPDIAETREVYVATESDLEKETNESKETESDLDKKDSVIHETMEDEEYKPDYVDELYNNYDYNIIKNLNRTQTNSATVMEDTLDGFSSSASVESSLTSKGLDFGFGVSNNESDVLIPNWNTEEYNSESENRFMSIKVSPFSTFGADVDTASYANLRRMILSGDTVVSDAVRIEEMINYFNYDYPEPKEDEPFSVTAEIAPCPWNSDTELLMLGLQTKKLAKEELPDSNLVFLIDVSGSMFSNDKLPLVINAFSLLTNELTEKDRISIVTYAGEDRVVLEGARGDEKEKILEALQSLNAGGGTNGADGIETAYKLAEKNFIQGGNNRVILATDGDLNIGPSSEGELVKLVQNKVDKNIFLSVMGFGTGNIKDNKMEALADNGNGNYSYIDSPIEAKRVLVDEMSSTLYTVAKDVKLQVEFNPAVIKGYRLIGYENREMASEDFSDDTKDGGEIGAGHRVTVLYEIVKNDSNFDIPEVESKYNNNSVDNSNTSEWLTLNIRYKEPEGSKSVLLSYPVSEEQYHESMSDNMNWASGVAQVGMLLKESEYAGTSNYEEVKNRLKLVNGVLDDEFKSEFIYMISRIENIE